MNYSIKPEEHELREAKQIVEGVLASCQIYHEKNQSFEIQLGWENQIRSGTNSAEQIAIGFNTQDDWKERLEIVTAYGYANSLFYESLDGNIEFKWQEVLKDAFGLIFVDEILPENAEKQTENIDEYEPENWSELREQLGDPIEDRPSEIPWQVSYLIGQELMKYHKFDDLTGLKRSQVLEAGDKAFQ